MKFFNFSWNKEHFVRKYVRRKRLTLFNRKWLELLLAGVQNLYSQFILFVKEYRERLIYTSQVKWLEKLFNDKFDYIERRIHIEDGQFIPVNNIYLIIEDQEPRYLYLVSEEEDPWYLYGLFDQEGVDFIVYIPVGVLTPQQIDQLIQYLENHKLAGKTYIIIEE